MMTCEQFVFWLSGYISAVKAEGSCRVDVQKLEEVIKNVNNPQLQKFAVYMTE